MIRLTVAVMLALLSSAASAMEIKIIDDIFTLSGEIRPGDYDRLIAYFKNDPHGFVNVNSISLDSPGGSVPEAMKLAKFIKETSRNTMVVEGARCMSACFFLLVAGGDRFLNENGKLGIHRPYYDPVGYKFLSPTKAREAYEKLDDVVRQFLTAVRIPDDIVRVMFSTPSSSIKLFTASEFSLQIGDR